jgi:hypothetical protein
MAKIIVADLIYGDEIELCLHPYDIAAAEIVHDANEAIDDSHTGLITIKQSMDRIRAAFSNVVISCDVEDLIGVDSFYLKDGKVKKSTKSKKENV